MPTEASLTSSPLRVDAPTLKKEQKALIFVGVYNAVVDAYNASLTRSTPTALSKARSNLAATTVGGKELFGGGISNSGYSAVVDTYEVAAID